MKYVNWEDGSTYSKGEEPTSVAIPEELLNETIVTLERVGCQSRYYCGRAPFDSSVLTTRCYVCETLAKLHELKRSA